MPGLASQERGAWDGGDGRRSSHARGTTNNCDRATPDQVFAFLTDPANDHRWRRHVKEISTSGPLRRGSVVHQVVRGPAGRGIRADFEVTAFEPSTRFAFNVTAGPVKPVGEFLFRPLGTGTEVTFSLRAELGGMKNLLMSRPVQSSMDSEAASLDTAKSLIERE